MDLKQLRGRLEALAVFRGLLSDPVVESLCAFLNRREGNSARAAVSADARDAYLHDAEAILLDDSPVIPVLCRGGSFQLADGLTGLYRAPDGVYFLQNIRQAVR